MPVSRIDLVVASPKIRAQFLFFHVMPLSFSPLSLFKYQCLNVSISDHKFDSCSFNLYRRKREKLGERQRILAHKKEKRKRIKHLSSTIHNLNSLTLTIELRKHFSSSLSRDFSTSSFSSMLSENGLTLVRTKV